MQGPSSRSVGSHESATPRMSLPFCSRLKAVDTFSGTDASLGRYAATLTDEQGRRDALWTCRSTPGTARSS